MSLWLAAIAMIAWGISDTTIKSLTNKYDALTTTVYKFIPHLLLLAIFFVIRGPVLPPDATTWMYLFGFGIIGAIALYAFVSAISRGMVSLAVAIAHINAAITAVLAAVFLNEILGGLHYAAIAAILLGVFLITADFNDLKLKRIKGLRMALVTAVGWGIIYIFLKLVVDRMDAIAAAFYADTIVIVLILIIYIIKKGSSIKLPKKKHAFLIISSAIASAVAAVFTSISFSHNKVAIAMAIIAAAPLVTYVLAVIFLKEKVNLQQGAGIIVITLGLVLIALLG